LYKFYVGACYADHEKIFVYFTKVQIVFPVLPHRWSKTDQQWNYVYICAYFINVANWDNCYLIKSYLLVQQLLNETSQFYLASFQFKDNNNCFNCNLLIMPAWHIFFQLVHTRNTFDANCVIWKLCGNDSSINTVVYFNK
jgi:hypothetical protein